MEHVSNFRTNTFYYGENIFYDIIYDFSGHQYDAWMFEKGSHQKVYITTIPDRIRSEEVKRVVKEEIASLLKQRKAG